nr:MAG: hypothetical protein DIU78_26370 [Pseudomonadota bacterium]
MFLPFGAEPESRTGLADLARHRHLPEGSEHVIERYAYERDGRVRVAVENPTRGFRREFVLGGPGSN